MKITACPRCGSTNISAGTMGSGILFGMSSWKEECRDCGYKGASIVFDSKEEYLTFLKEVKGKEYGCDEKKQQSSVLVDSKNDEVVCDQEPNQHWHKRDWWIEIAIALLLTVGLSVYGSIVSSSWYGLATGVLYTLLGFVLTFVIFLTMIVVFEYFVYLIVKSIKKSC